MTTIVTKEELLSMANSSSAEERKRAFKLFNDWLRAAPKLSPLDRISATERHIFMQVFASKGMTMTKVPTPAGSPTPRTPPTGPRMQPPRR